MLAYPKFCLGDEEQRELLGEYLVYCETVEWVEPCPLACRDKTDQAFLDLAYSGKADVLVTGDRALLELAGRTEFAIETPAAYRRLVGPERRCGKA